MTKKLKGCRPLEQINNEYSLLCGQLGNFTFRRATLAKEIEVINRRLAELDFEAGAAKEQMEEAAASLKKAAEAKGIANPTDKDGNEYVPCTTDECLKAESAAATA